MRPLRLATRSIRARWTTLLGSFFALALGVAMIAAMCLALDSAVGLPAGEELTTAIALLGTAAGVTGFVSVFVVASTFSYAVAQRRRELGLLRLAGAGRGLIRRLVLGEALLLGAVASAAGCVLGGQAAPRLVRWLVAERLAPAGLGVGGSWPYHVAFWTGLTVAGAGAAAAAHRAGRVSPMEALKEADVDGRVMTLARWLVGGGLLATAAVLLGWRLATGPGELLHRKTYTVQPMLLITAVALLAPVTATPLCRLVGRLLPGWAGRVVRANASAGVRRTAAVAAPVLMTVALAGSLLGTAGTVQAAKAAEAAAQSRADYVLTGDLRDGAGTLARLRAQPGVRAAAASAATRVETVEDSDHRIASEGRAVDPYDLAALTRLPVAAGRLTDLDDDSIVVNEEWLRHRVGDTVPVWRADGTRRDLRIAAVLHTGTGDNGVYVTPANAPGARTDRIDIRGARPTALPPGAELRTKAQWLADTYPRTSSRATRAGFFLILGIALVYALIVLANTLVMATADRVRALAVLRLTGATKPQVLAVVAAEALLTVTAGALLGGAVTAVNLGGVAAALGLLGAAAPPAVPWPALGALTAACAAVAVPAAVLPAWRALRVRPVEGALTS